MEKSLQLAIAKAKRNIESMRYDKLTNFIDAALQYGVRIDEIDQMAQSLNKWIIKNQGRLFDKPFTDHDIKCIKMGIK